MTAEWYRRWLSGDADLQQLSLAQISEYEAAMR